MEKLPTYLTQNVYNVKNDDYLSVDIKSKQGNTLLKYITMAICMN